MSFVNHFGLDIGTHTVKAVQLSPSESNRYQLSVFGDMPTPELSDSPEKAFSTAEAIKTFIKDTKISTKQVAISLPEAQVYTRVIEMPFMEEAELASAIHWQAEQYIPVPLTEVVLKHQIVSPPVTGKPGSKMRVLLVAAPNNLVNGYISLVQHAGLDPIAVETEVISITRSLIENRQEIIPPTVLLHLGQSSSIIAVVVDGQIIFTQAFSTGGLAITRAISASLNMALPQSEQYKKTFGLDDQKLDGKLIQVIKPITDMIISEIQRTLVYMDTLQAGVEIKRVVLSGGTSLIPNFVHTVTQRLGFETLIGNPFEKIKISDQQKAAIGDNLPIYSVAVGLALKQI